MTTPTGNSATNMLMDSLVQVLENHLITIQDVDVPNYHDEAIAGLVRKGKLQDDPTVYGITLLVHPASEKHPEELYDKDQHGGFQLGPTFEIGGPYAPYFWIKPLHIQFILFFDGEVDRSIAQTKAQVVLSRARRAAYLLNGEMANIPRDIYGEKAHIVIVKEAYLREAGGSGTYIWKGAMLIHVLTNVEVEGDIS